MAMNYCMLNARIIFDCHTLSQIYDILESFQGYKNFSRIKLNSEFHKILLEKWLEYKIHFSESGGYSSKQFYHKDWLMNLIHFSIFEWYNVTLFG